MDNQDIARIFEQISDLLEIKGANPFKIRAYRNAAETLASIAERVSDMEVDALRAIPGIGKDLATRIRELSETGTSAYHTELLEQYPVSLLELLKRGACEVEQDNTWGDIRVRGPVQPPASDC